MYTIAKRLAGIERDSCLQVKVDVSAALDLFQRCIDEHAHFEAMYDLAKILVSQAAPNRSDVCRAAELFQRCVVEANHPDAMYRLARIFASRRKLVPNDLARAAHLYDSYIHMTRCGDAMYRLAAILATGAPGVATDIRRAMRLYQSCVDAENNVQAMFELAKILVAGKHCVEKDIPRALRLFERHVAVTSRIVHIIDLANCLSYGTGGVVKDRSLAVRLLQICIDVRGDATAMVSLAELLLIGSPDVPKDLDSAVWLIKNSLEKDFVNRKMYNLIRSIAFGTLAVPRNLPIAEMLCRMYYNTMHSSEALILHAEILATGAPHFPRDDERVARMCQRYINSYSQNDTDVNLFNSCAPVVRLAVKIAYGKSGFAGDGRFAAQLLELCIMHRDDSEAMVILAEMMLHGCSNLEKNVDLAMRLFEMSLNAGRSRSQYQRGYRPRYQPLYIHKSMTRAWYTYQGPFRIGRENRSQLEFRPPYQPEKQILYLARHIASGTRAIKPNLRLAIDLCQMCINRGIDTGCLTLAEILTTDAPGSWRCTARVVRLCETYVHMRKNCTLVRNLAQHLAHGTSGLVRNAPLAARLLRICINKRNDEESMVLLAEVTMAGWAGVGRDFHLAMMLCEQALNAGISTSRLLQLAIGMGAKSLSIVANAQFAVTLCEMCIMRRNTPAATIALMEVLIRGPSETRDVDRVIHLCHHYVNENISLDPIMRLVLLILRGVDLLVEDTSLAVALLETCITVRADTTCMVTLAEILVNGTQNVQRDTERVVQLCDRSITHSESCAQVVSLARRIADRCARTALTQGTQYNMQLAIQLLETCMLRMNDAYSMYSLAEILLTDAAGIERDTGRVVELCVRLAAREQRGWVVHIARKLVCGTRSTRRDVPLAVHLCQICMDGGGGAESGRAAGVLARALVEDGGVRRDVSLAVGLCEMCVENDCCDVVVEVARSLARAGCVERDVLLALQLLELCVARRNDGVAMRYLAKLVGERAPEIQVDALRADELMRCAGLLGDVDKLDGGRRL